MPATRLKNTQAKMVKPENAYEYWASTGHGDVWVWAVLKKWQATDMEEKNPYSRWMCKVYTPMCPEGEMGDTYVYEIKLQARQIGKSYAESLISILQGCEVVAIKW